MGQQIVDDQRRDIVAHQIKEAAFRSTPIGAAFQKMVLAASRAWVTDTTAGFSDHTSDRRLKEVWDAEHKATAEFRRLLDALVTEHADMLAALRLIDEFAWTSLAADFPEAKAEVNRRVNVCRAAIAKATGAQS